MIANNNVSSQEQFSPLVRDNPNAKRALFFGDSWFQYPLPLIDLNKQLAKRFRSTCMLNEAVPGRDSAQWKLSLPRIQREIGSYDFDAILLSNGGNDVVGTELPEFLKKPSQAQSPGTTKWGVIPPVVYDHVRLDRFEVALHYAIVDFQEIIDYRDQSSPRTVIFLHTYDYVYPSGIPWKLGPIKEGPWIKPSLEAVDLIDPAEQRILTSWLVDQFAGALQAFASTVKDVRIVDSRGTLTSPKQWSNEIHPTKSGFALIATQCWVPQLQALLN